MRTHWYGALAIVAVAPTRPDSAVNVGPYGVMSAHDVQGGATKIPWCAYFRSRRVTSASLHRLRGNVPV